ncbi:MAG: thioredoxin domain-containing protein [Thermoanaerobaculia bacterium]|jgi:hypothetical protein
MSIAQAFVILLPLLLVASAIDSPALPSAEAAASPAQAAPAAQPTNRLIHEKSPYLLQHAHNPVDWYPWGEAAFQKARDENKPIFLSIGYSTCHWCHVMEEESFSDPLVAEMMNATFVSIKVDREERPDIDSVYMSVSQLLTGSGGWPLTILMTPGKEPFWAGTYIPKDDRFGRTGMLTLIPAISKAWNEQGADIARSAKQITAALQEQVGAEGGGVLERSILEQAHDSMAQQFDRQRGGFLPAPKFPSPHQYLFLLRYWNRTGDKDALEMVETTLGAMRNGGIRDHVGYGFHRYSTDPEWLVPHFEKMLYDQAMLAMAYTETFQATGKPEYQRTAEQIFEYAIRDMRDVKGGFYSAEDADSEGKEGKFYVWTEQEIRKLLGEDADLAIEAWGITTDGNFRDQVGGETGNGNILHTAKSPSQIAALRNLGESEVRSRLEAARAKLFAAREKRVRPQRDDKVLTDWNGLMIAALAQASETFGEPRYAKEAASTADFILATMRTKDGRLLHRYRAGEAGVAATVNDYAFVVWGLLNLYEATFELRYLEAAIQLEKRSLELFWDEKNGGFFLTAHDAETLLARPKETYDGTLPSGNSVQLMNLVRIGKITADPAWEARADKLVLSLSDTVRRSPTSSLYLLGALDFALGPSYEIVLVGGRDSAGLRAFRGALASVYLPNKVVVFRSAGEKTPAVSKLAPYTLAHRAIGQKATAYVCMNYSCKLPTNDPAVMLKQLQPKEHARSRSESRSGESNGGAASHP